MPTITKISRNKRNSNVSVFIDDEFGFSCTENFMVKAGLYSEKELSSEQLEKLTEDSIIDRNYNRLLGLLSRRMRSEYEIKQRLREYSYKDKIKIEEETVNKLLKRLKKNNYIDDKAFSIWLAESRMRQEKKSWSEIKLELRKKGIKSNIIDEVENDLKTKVDSFEVRTLKKLAIKKKKHFTNKMFSAKEALNKTKTYFYSKRFRSKNIDEALADK